MVTWIVLATVVLSLLVLVLAVRSVLVRLPRLQRAAVTLLQRQTQAESLLSGVEALQERGLSLQRQVETLDRKIAIIKARRGS